LKRLRGMLFQISLLLAAGLGCSSIHTYRDRASYRAHGKQHEQIAGRSLAAQKEGSSWVLPLQDWTLTSRYGRRGRDFHEGIDLRAPSGTPVNSVAAGQVIYADSRIGGYGRMIVIRHDSGLSTVYAHNSRLLVKKGQRVSRGQRISLSGSTGRSTGPHLHFEIRQGALPLDPTVVLSRSRSRLASARR